MVKECRMRLALWVFQKTRVDSEEVAGEVVLKKNLDLGFTDSCLFEISNVSLCGHAHIHILFVSQQCFDGSRWDWEIVPREWVQQCSPGDQGF